MPGPSNTDFVEIAPGIRRLTAPNPGAMTGTGTQSFVLGRGSVVVIDPGPTGKGGHLDRLLSLLRHEDIAGFAVTHRHDDHAGACAELAARTGAQKLDTDALGAQGIETLAAPGHTADHVVFRHGRTLLTGDHVFKTTSTLIDWPDGTLTDFMKTTRALLNMTDCAFHPAHGAPLTDPEARLRWLLRHRETRSADILRIIGDRGALPFETILQRLYGDLPSGLRAAASRNLMAHLSHLETTGRVERPGDAAKNYRALRN